METTKVNVDEAYMKPMIVLKDKKSRAWSAPVVYPSVDAARRELVHAAKYGKGIDGNPPLFKDYPEDFELVCVGYYNTITGEIMPGKMVVDSVSSILPKE